MKPYKKILQDSYIDGTTQIQRGVQDLISLGKQDHYTMFEIVTGIRAGLGLYFESQGYDPIEEKQAVDNFMRSLKNFIK